MLLYPQVSQVELLSPGGSAGGRDWQHIGVEIQQPVKEAEMGCSGEEVGGAREDGGIRAEERAASPVYQYLNVPPLVPHSTLATPQELSNTLVVHLGTLLVLVITPLLLSLESMALHLAFIKIPSMLTSPLASQLSMTLSGPSQYSKALLWCVCMFVCVLVVISCV